MKNNTNANIDKVSNINIDSNIDRTPYSLRKGFKLNTKDSVTASEISQKLNDSDNFAFYLSAVKKLGVERAWQIYHEAKFDVDRGKRLGKPIKNPPALYNWKVKKELNKRI